MAIHPDIRDEAFGFFVQEAPELLQIIEAELLEIRQDCNVGRVHALMRAAHTIKGGAANVGLDAIKTIAHQLEDYLRCLYNPDLQIDESLERLYLQGYDCLRIPLMEAIQVGNHWAEGEAAIAAAEPIFAQLHDRLADFLTGEDQLPSVEEMGVDIAQAIFETDVTQALERLASLELSNPLLGAELRAQAEVFEGIAELLNLRGLTQIVRLVLSALNSHPDRAAELFPIALENFRIAQQAVLNGDRFEGGTPSLALQSFGESKSALEEGAIADSLFCDLESFSSTEEQSPFFSDLESVFSSASGESSSDGWLTHSPESTDLESLFAEQINFSSPFDSDSFTPSADVADPFWAEPEQSLLPELSEEIFSDRFLDFPDQNKIDSIESAIAALQQGFEQLPVATTPVEIEPPISEPSIVQPELIQLEPTQSESIQPESIHSESTQPMPTVVSENQISVRLNLAQLERISNQLGELSINRNSLSLQNEQLQETLQELRRRFGYFLAIGTQLKVHLNKLLISPERYALAQQTSSTIAFQGRSSTALVISEKADLSYRSAFDTLELDRYNEVYNLLQDATESIQQLDEAVEDVTLFAEQSDRGLEQQRQILTILRDELMWARMLPLGNILNRFPRQIKDLSYQYNKPVSLKLTGTEVLVDKVVLEKLYDPLLHLLRNAFDHGIEPRDVRERQGKPEQGTIHIQVYHRGSRTVIEVEDDGRGIDLERIRNKALENGLLSTEAAKTASSDRLLNLIFEPGFSTAAQVSELSGRGVGLDIVRAQIQSLKGSIAVKSQPGKGTLFTLRIPLTLSISKLLLTWSGTSLAAIPSDSIEEIVNPNPTDLKTSSEQHFLQWRGQVIPIHSLQELLPFNCSIPTVAANLSFNSVPTPEEWAAPLLILRQGNQPFALQVDRLITEQELVIKPFSSTLTAPTYLYGCTILGDGSVVPVIDAVTLLLHRQGHKPAAISAARHSNESDRLIGASAHPIQTAATILIVDDAATMRRMLTLTLKKAGYQVLQARDGREALEQLHQHPQVQLVICDIEMPIMNGFEFLTQRRQNTALLNIPVIMLTSRSGDKHRKLALHLGATDYFTKPYIEQQFLSQIKTVLQPGSRD